MIIINRKFIPGYAAIAAPLTDLTKKGVFFEWNVRCEWAFEELKRLLSSAPLLALPDLQLPFVMATDASDEAIGAVSGNLGY